MAFDYDPSMSSFERPVLGEQVRIIIGQNEERTSSAGNPMLVMETKVAKGQQGAGFGTKFYAVQFNIGWVMAATGIDPDVPQVVDDMTFRGRDAAVIFGEEEYTNRDGEKKKATKIVKWIPRDKATIRLSADPTQAATEEEFGPASETEAAMNAQAPPNKEEYTDQIPF